MAANSGPPAASLRDAVRRAFPKRADIAELNFEGSEAQAWAVYVRMLSIQPAELARAVAPFFGVKPAGKLDAGAIDPAVLKLIPFNLCQRNNILPLRWADGGLAVATAKPYDEDLSSRVQFLLGKPVRWLLAPPEAIEDAVLRTFSREADRDAQSYGGVAVEDESAVDENAIVRLGRSLVNRAIELRASDLHIQPYLGAAAVRIRVDGVMRRLTVLPDAVAGMLIRHIKARAGMDPSNTQIPQDGRISATADGRNYEMRISALPAARGERLVIRFLSQTQVYRLSSAGFELSALQTLRRAVARPAGLVVITGPTGSGKTSTLYAMIAEINRSDINIITVENPVEYRIPGVSQVDVNEKAGRTFAAALRSILRQDPDVILIGEVRDRETAEIAVQAALTGHLVLTTLHTNDAMTAIPRLLDIGIQPSVLADSLVMVASQRLCRLLCTYCRMRVSEPLTPEERMFHEITHNMPANRAVGCEKCEFTGYRGRLPIVDIVEMNRKLRDAVATGEARLGALEELREGGLKSLAASGSGRVISGDTTVREVMDTVGPSFWNELAAHYGRYFSTEVAESIPLNAARGFGVLLIGGGDTAFADRLRSALAGEGLQLVAVKDAETAGEMLHKDEEIAFAIADIPEGMDLQQVKEALHRNRVNIAWARVPAAVLLPRSLVGQEEALRSSGVMAAFLPKPADLPELVAHIRRAQAL